MPSQRVLSVLVLVAALLLLQAPLSTLGEVSGPHGPKGTFAGKSSGRCGAFTGSEAVEASKEALESGSGFDDTVVVCQKHLREHETKLMHTKIGGTVVKYQVFADSDDMPDSSTDIEASSSSKSSSDSSPAADSSSSDSVAPVLTSVSFIARLVPTPSGRRHMLQAFVTSTPTEDEVGAIGDWIGDFARDNADIVDGRDSITATSFKRGVGGVIFFTVFIRTADPATVEARIVELPVYVSSVGDATLSEPQPCGNGEDVRFGDEEDLAAQLSVAPPPGCSNPLDPVVAAPAPVPPAVIPTTAAATTTASQTTTAEATTSPSQTTTAEATTTASQTTTAEATTTPSQTTTAEATTTPSQTTTAEATTTPSQTTTAEATTTPSQTTTAEATTTPSQTTTTCPPTKRRHLLFGHRKLLVPTCID